MQVGRISTCCKTEDLLFEAIWLCFWDIFSRSPFSIRFPEYLTMTSRSLRWGRGWVVEIRIGLKLGPCMEFWLFVVWLKPAKLGEPVYWALPPTEGGPTE